VAVHHAAVHRLGPEPGQQLPDRDRPGTDRGGRARVDRQTAALVTALYLASAIAQPTAGKVAEVFGPRRVFLAGIFLVLAGGLLGGFAPDLLTLLASRALIGLGTSCAYPTAMLLIRRRAQQAGMDTPPGGVLGGLQIAGIATASLGLPIGGVLVDALGWRAVFFVNVPVALIALSATLLWIPKDAPPEGSRRAREVASRIDAAGIAGFALAMTALLMFLFSLPRPDWVMLGVTVAAWIALVAWELRARSPFFDVRLLASNLALTRTYLRFALILLCVYIVLYGITQWLEAGRGFSAISTGLLLLPMTAISGVIIAPISRRNLVRGPVIAAAIACLAGSAGVLFLGSSTSIVWIIAITLAFGVAMGAGASGNQTALYTQAPADQLRHRQTDALAPGVEERRFDCTLCEVVALDGFADRVHSLRYAGRIGGFQNRCDVPIDGKLHTLGTFGPVREATDGRAFAEARYAVRADDFDDHQGLRLHGRDG